MTRYTLPLADAGAVLETVGGKGASLARLSAAGLPVPDGFHVTTDAYRQFVQANGLQPGIDSALAGVQAAQPASLDSAAHAIHAAFDRAMMPPEVAAAIGEAYGQMAGEDPAVAVRSSATAEDLPELSFAGQQDTFLNQRGTTEVLAAVKRCWASLWTARAIGYRARNGIDQRSVSLAVVVQALVPAEAAGILFTANPVDGDRGQVVINAAWGLGEAVVGGRVTPDTLMVDKAGGRILARETADKQVMTSRAAGGTVTLDTPEALRRAPVLDDWAAAELARLGVRIEALYGQPMDVEWALAGGRFAILQARPITALPPARAPVPTEWKLPHPKGHYMRGSTADLLPDPLSPLYATLGFPAIAGIGFGRLMQTFMPGGFFLPEDYLCTINGYAYTGIHFTGRQWLLFFASVLPAFLRHLRRLIGYWRDVARPRYASIAASWEERPFGSLPAAELLRAAREITGAAGEYMAGLLVGTMGTSAGAEMLFRRVYDRLVKRPGDPEATAFLLGYDSTPIQADKSLHDLAMRCLQHGQLAALVTATPGPQLAARLAQAGAPPDPVAGWEEFKARLQEHARRFGHVIYELDFAKPLPLDDPAPWLEAIRMYARGEGQDPHARQRALEERRVQSTDAMLRRLKGLRRWAFRKAVGWAQSMSAVRETALADIGLGYPALRAALRELGRRMAQAGAIAQADDIFWCEWAEVEAAGGALDRGAGLDKLAERVAQRKATWEAARRAVPPPMLPPARRYMGIDMTDYIPATEDSQSADVLKGNAASAGRVTAPACLLLGPEDFGRMRPGRILVASITTPAWTPLFAMAAGVVTDVGGPLSHGSIVAREYGIPAVLGTGVATRRIRDGQMVTVDGDAGTVALTG
jgi:pyruvate,water dikinase